MFGVFGTLSGVAGAATFIPYRTVSTFHPSLAVPLTAIALIGAAVSLLGVVAGFGLLKARRWGWETAMGTALGGIASVGAMAAFWPPFASFVVLVVVAYGLEILLLLTGAGFFRVDTTRPSSG